MDWTDDSSGVALSRRTCTIKHCTMWTICLRNLQASVCVCSYLISFIWSSSPSPIPIPLIPSILFGPLLHLNVRIKISIVHCEQCLRANRPSLVDWGCTDYIIAMSSVAIDHRLMDSRQLHQANKLHPCQETTTTIAIPHCKITKAPIITLQFRSH